MSLRDHLNHGERFFRMESMWEKDSAKTGTFCRFAQRNPTAGLGLAVGLQNPARNETAKWPKLMAVSAGMYNLVAVKPNGKFVSTGISENVQYDLMGWTEIRLPERLEKANDGTFVLHDPHWP